MTCPRALFGKDEDILDAARRELKEETGLDALALRILHPGAYLSGGGTSEKLALILAHVDMRRAGGVHGLAEENEDLKSVIMPARDFIRAGRRGELRDAGATMAAQYLAGMRGSLRASYNLSAARRSAQRVFGMKRRKPK